MAAPLTRWLPETFDADALSRVPEGVTVDYLLPEPDGADEALSAWLDAYAVAVEADDAEGVQALRAMLADGLRETAGEDTKESLRSEGQPGEGEPDEVPDWARPIIDDPDNPFGGDWIDADEDGEPLWPDEPAEAVTESKKRSAFTGEKRDSIGRRRCYKDGRQVKCEPVPDDPEPAAPTDPSRPWDAPDWERVPGKGARPRWVNREGVVRYGNRPLERPEAEKRAEWEARQRRLAEPPRVSLAADPEAAGRAKAFTAAAFGSDEQVYAKLLGVPNGTRIGVGVSAFDPKAAFLSLDHPDTDHWSRTLRAAPDGTVSVYNNMFFLKPGARGSGFGAKAFAEQVRGCFLAGVSSITTTAGKGGSGGDKMNGYYTWARFGYDADLEPRYRYRLPPELKGARTIQDLMETEAGRRHWRATGYMTSMTFDLSPGSRSLKRLNQYLAEKGKGTPPIPDADAAVVAERERVIADRKSRLAAYVPPPPPPPPTPAVAGQPAQSPSDRQAEIVAGMRQERYARIVNPVAQRWRAAVGDAVLPDLARRVTTDPEYGLSGLLDRHDNAGLRAAEEQANNVWLRHARRLADERFMAATADGTDGSELLRRVSRDAESIMRGTGALLDELVWRVAGARYYDLATGASRPAEAVREALYLAWTRVDGGQSLTSNNIPSYLRYQPPGS